ncbi:MAG: ComEC/Rec2 family competence protein [Flavobacteriales bacterium]|nr:ComEC/Rec2 family competence protein [Flavobacteriales bacterium]
MHGSGNLTSAFVRAPLLRAAVPFILGLVAGRFFMIPWVVGWVVVLSSFGLCLFLSLRKQEYGLRWIPGIALFILIFSFGNLWQNIRSDLARTDHVEQLVDSATGWEVQVMEVASDNGRTMRAWTQVRAAVVAGVLQPASGAMMVTILHDSTRRAVQIHDRIVLASKATRIDKMPNPGGFDVRQWAGSRGVYHESFAPMDRWDFTSGPSKSKNLFEQARQHISGWLLESGLPDRERALAKAILLGMRDELARDQNQAFVRSGTIHVLAVSGTHVGIIYVAVLWGLSFLGKDKRSRLIRGIMALIALWAYAGLTGFSPSVLRATIMFSLFTLAEMSRGRTESLNSLAFAAIGLLLWDPLMLMHLGFQLSFLAVLGIAVFYRPIHLLWAPPHAVGRFFWSLIVVSLAAQAFTIPLCLYVFQAFPVWFLPANMAIVGLVGLGVYGGIVVIVVHAIPVLGPIFTALMKWLLLLLGFLSAFFAGLPGAYPAVRIGFWGMVGLYVLLAFFAMWMMQGRKWARLATLTTVAILLFGWGWTARQRNTQESFTAYTDRDGFSGAFLHGRTLYAFNPTGNEWIERNVEDHARSVGAYRVVHVDSLPHWVVHGKKSYAFLPVDRTAKGHPWPSTPSTIVLYGQGWLDTKACASGRGSEWILSADMEGTPRAMMRRWAKENDAAVFDMRLAGAYVRP